MFIIRSIIINVKLFQAKHFAWLAVPNNDYKSVIGWCLGTSNFIPAQATK